MNIISQLTVNDHESINVYGNIRDPLFKCSEILINLLGYSESNKNRFYMDNKTNTKYVTALADCEASSQPVSVNQYS